MPENTEPTIESLQAQVLQLTEDAQKRNAEFDQLKADKEKVEKDLSEARAINTKLWLRGDSNATGIANSDDGKEHEETLDEFIDSFITPNLEKMRVTYGDKTLGEKVN